MVTFTDSRMSWYHVRYDGRHRDYPFITRTIRKLQLVALMRVTSFFLVTWIILLILVILSPVVDFPSLASFPRLLASLWEFMLMAMMISLFIGGSLLILESPSLFLGDYTAEGRHARLREAFLQHEGSIPDYYHVLSIDVRVRAVSSASQLVVLPERVVLGFRIMRWERSESHGHYHARSIIDEGFGVRVVLVGGLELTVVPSEDVRNRELVHDMVRQACDFLGRNFDVEHVYKLPDTPRSMVIRGYQDKDAEEEVSDGLMTELGHLREREPVFDPSMIIPLQQVVAWNDLLIKK